MIRHHFKVIEDLNITDLRFTWEGKCEFKIYGQKYCVMNGDLPTRGEEGCLYVTKNKDTFVFMDGEFHLIGNFAAEEKIEQKLKLCPFCGGEAKVMDMGFPHWVYCENCGAKVHGGTHDEKDSIEAWNRRANE